MANKNWRVLLATRELIKPWPLLITEKYTRSEAIAVMTYFHIISLFEAGSGIKDVQA
ncbi:hypothetical protein ACFCZD_17965 [Bacillus safensis]|uniref:hypothetical protein n=1 Tax=Bacillus safensis TaxID=561879 RepID=UPI0035DF79FF